jgi:hypothetical protein
MKTIQCLLTDRFVDAITVSVMPVVWRNELPLFGSQDKEAG